MAEYFIGPLDLGLIQETQQLGSGECVHKINNLIQIYKGYTEILLSESSLPKEERLEMIKQVNKNHSELRRLVVSKRLEKYKDLCYNL